MSAILIVNYAFPPFGGAASRRVAKLVKYLGRQGMRSVVVTAPRVVNPLIDPTAADDLSADTVVVRTRSLEPLPAPGRDSAFLSALRRIANVPLIPNVAVLWSMFAIGPALAAAREYKAKAVFCSAPEFPAFLVGARVKRELGIPLILDYRDEWTSHPEKIASLAGSPARRLKFNLELSLEKRLQAAADLIIANTDSFRSEMIESLGADPQKITVIPNGFDPEDFPGPAPAIEPQVITHLGSLDHASLLPPALLAAFAKIGRKAELRLIGKVRSELRRKWEGENRGQVTLNFMGFLPAREAIARLRQSGLNLLVNELLPGKERYHNLKMFDYLKAGRPILHLGPVDGEIAKVVSRSGLGAVIDPADGRAMEKYLADWVEGRLSVSPDLDYLEGFNFAVLAGRLKEEVGRLA